MRVTCKVTYGVLHICTSVQYKVNPHPKFVRDQVVSCGGLANRWADPPLLPPDFLSVFLKIARSVIVSMRAVVARGIPGFIPGFPRSVDIRTLWGYNGLLPVLNSAHSNQSVFLAHKVNPDRGTLSKRAL